MHSRGRGGAQHNEQRFQSLLCLEAVQHFGEMSVPAAFLTARQISETLVTFRCEAQEGVSH